MRAQQIPVWIVALHLATAVQGMGTECQPVDGLSPLLQPGGVVVFGEIHGTTEAPTFVANAVCLAASAGHGVTVGLEVPVEETERFEAYLASAGTPAARGALLAGDFWHGEYQDGRRSVAMLELVESIRRLRAADHDVTVALFDSAARAESGQARDRKMAAALQRAVASSADRVVIVLTGNIHSRSTLGTPWDSDYAPLTHLLSTELGERPLTSLNLSTAGGTAWICSGASPADCGERKMGGGDEITTWRVTLHDEVKAGHHGLFHVGTITASPPAISDLAPEGDRPRQ